MNFETLKKKHKKRNIIIGVVAVLVVSAVILNFTRAKYRVTESIPLVNGTINYSLADINIVAITVDGENVTELPDGNYNLLDTSYCTVNNVRDDSIELIYDSATKTLSVIPFTTKGTRCYLDFETTTTKKVDTILGELDVNLDTPNFSKTSCTNGSNLSGNCGEETVGLYEATTSKGTTYYYRGDVEDNYLVFAGFYWRIIRINEDGTIRIIYDGTSAHENGASSTDRQIGESAYNSSYNHSEYVGYTYVEGYQRPSDSLDTEPTPSTIKGVLDTWYGENLQEYDNYIDGDAEFCND